MWSANPGRFLLSLNLFLALLICFWIFWVGLNSSVLSLSVSHLLQRISPFSCRVAPADFFNPSTNFSYWPSSSSMSFFLPWFKAVSSFWDRSSAYSSSSFFFLKLGKFMCLWRHRLLIYVILSCNIEVINWNWNIGQSLGK